MLVRMVPLVDLGRFEQDLLIQDVKSASEVECLLRVLIWKKVRYEYKLRLTAWVRLHHNRG